MTMLRQLRRRLQMKSKIALFFMILISFLLQCTLLHVISIGSITPNLILILCISMGLMRGRKSGLWTGFFCGFLVDMAFFADMPTGSAMMMTYRFRLCLQVSGIYCTDFLSMHCSFCSGDVWGSEPIYTGLFYRRFFIQ